MGWFDWGSDSRDPKVWASLAILIVAAILFAFSGMDAPNYCTALRAADKNAWCPELILSRYQTLLGAIVAIAAAIVATSKVRHQISVAIEAMQVSRKQYFSEREKVQSARFVALRNAQNAIRACGDSARALHSMMHHASWRDFTRAEEIAKECADATVVARVLHEALVLPMENNEELWTLLRAVTTLEYDTRDVVREMQRQKSTFGEHVWNNDFRDLRDAFAKRGGELRINLYKYSDKLSPFVVRANAEVQNARVQTAET